MKKSMILCALLATLILFSTNIYGKKNFITKVEVLGKSPSQIYGFMFGLNKQKYLAWHEEHKDFKIVGQTKDTLGSVFFFHERMDKLTVKYKWKVTSIVPNHKIVMKAEYFIPIYLTLIFDKTLNGTLVTHDLQVGTNPNSKILDWFVGTFILTKSKQKSQDRHAIEEFKNLEKLIQ